MLKFYSGLAAQIQVFINLRRLSGTDYHSQALLLSYFDHFLAEKSYQGTTITRDITDEYQASLLSLAPRTRNNRFCVVRQLCEYIASTDPRSCVPESMRNISSSVTYKPYIYTLNDIQALMNATARLTPTDSLRPHTSRTLLGLLYATGIRIGEALALNIEDFYRDEQRIFIANGKFRKARWIPLSTSTCTAIDAYIKKRCQCEHCVLDSPLFINVRNRRLKHSSVSHDFHYLLELTGIPSNKEQHPRIHDLRHTFATQRLLNWYKEGLDVNALLPALATYMGHVGIVSTQLYLQPTNDLIVQVNQRFYHHYLEQVKPVGELS
jgi:site-specific recombinase XerD